MEKLDGDSVNALSIRVSFSHSPALGSLPKAGPVTRSDSSPTKKGRDMEEFFNGIRRTG